MKCRTPLCCSLAPPLMPAPALESLKDEVCIRFVWFAMFTIDLVPPFYRQYKIIVLATTRCFSYFSSSKKMLQLSELNTNNSLSTTLHI